MNKKSTILGLNCNILLIVMYVLSLIMCLLPGLCYFCWTIPTLVFIFENKNEFVKKQACQAIMLFLLVSLFNLIVYIFQLALVPVTYVQYADVTVTGFRLFISSVINIIHIIFIVFVFIISIIAMIRIYNYSDYLIPIIDSYYLRFRSLLDKIVGNNEVYEEKVVIPRSNIVVGELFNNDLYKDKVTEKNKKKVSDRHEKK